MKHAAVAAIALAAILARPVAAADPATVRLDWLHTSYHAPFFLGIDKGWYRDAGIELTVTEGRGSGNVVQLVGNGTDTFGFAGADAVVRGVQTGIPVLSVATIMPRNADTVFAMASSGIATVGDLKGRRIGSTPGGTSGTLLPAFLKGAGLADGEVTTIPVDAQLKAQLLLQGKLDAMTGPTWGRAVLVARGPVVAFAYADYGVEVVGYVIVVAAKTASENPDLVSRFLSATLKSWSYAADHPDEAFAAFRAHAPESIKRNGEGAYGDMLEALKLVRPAVAGKPFGTQSEADWDRMQKQLAEYGAVKQTLPVERYLTNRFLR